MHKIIKGPFNNNNNTILILRKKIHNIIMMYKEIKKKISTQIRGLLGLFLVFIPFKFFIGVYIEIYVFGLKYFGLAYLTLK